MKRKLLVVLFVLPFLLMTPVFAQSQRAHFRALRTGSGLAQSNLSAATGRHAATVEWANPKAPGLHHHAGRIAGVDRIDRSGRSLRHSRRAIKPPSRTLERSHNHPRVQADRSSADANR